MLKIFHLDFWTHAKVKTRCFIQVYQALDDYRLFWICNLSKIIIKGSRRVFIMIGFRLLLELLRRMSMPFMLLQSPRRGAGWWLKFGCHNYVGSACSAWDFKSSTPDWVPCDAVWFGGYLWSWSAGLTLWIELFGGSARGE